VNSKSIFSLSFSAAREEIFSPIELYDRHKQSDIDKELQTRFHSPVPLSVSSSTLNDYPNYTKKGWNFPALLLFPN
jgi:hypothetical protein